MAKNSQQMVEAVVAKRRTVDIDGVLYGPGKTVTLPFAEVQSLWRNGFVIDPASTNAETDDEGGVSVESAEQ